MTDDYTELDQILDLDVIETNTEFPGKKIRTSDVTNSFKLDTTEFGTFRDDQEVVKYVDPVADEEKTRLLRMMGPDDLNLQPNGSFLLDDSMMDISMPSKLIKYVFLITGVAKDVRLQLETIICQLGGEFSDIWRSDCTHVLAGKPSKTEKCLAACAAGLWYT
jgi:hypothetical protein